MAMTCPQCHTTFDEPSAIEPDDVVRCLTCGEFSYAEADHLRPLTEEEQSDVGACLTCGAVYVGEVDIPLCVDCLLTVPGGCPKCRAFMSVRQCELHRAWHVAVTHADGCPMVDLKIDCPHCGHESQLDPTTPLTTDVGARLLCAPCGGVAVLDFETLSLRKLTEEEQAVVDAMPSVTALRAELLWHAHAD